MDDPGCVCAGKPLHHPGKLQGSETCPDCPGISFRLSIPQEEPVQKADSGRIKVRPYERCPDRDIFFITDFPKRLRAGIKRLPVRQIGFRILSSASGKNTVCAQMDHFRIRPRRDLCEKVRKPGIHPDSLSPVGLRLPVQDPGTVYDCVKVPGFHDFSHKVRSRQIPGLTVGKALRPSGNSRYPMPFFF